MKQALLSIILLSAILPCSCIREEAPNAEADIVSCTLSDASLLAADVSVDMPYDHNLGAYPIVIVVREGTDVTWLAPVFTLTPGASIDPPSGSVLDFSGPVLYTVTSEDGNWQRRYSVSVIVNSVSDLPASYHFETISTGPGYHVFSESTAHRTVTWASGNPGFRMSASSAAPADYPTSQSEDGYEGSCARLVTRSTGSLGALVGMPLAAGNLFMGNFNTGSAMSDPLAATRFGEVCNRKPLSLSGYYKYEPGAQMQDGSSPVEGTDEPDIYAIFFENTDAFGNSVTIDGNLPGNDFQHASMVALARLEDHGAKSDWTRFELEFDYGRYGKTVDVTRLAAGGYSFAIVMSSSVGGAAFRGAIGSTLCVDELEIVFE